MIRRFGESSGHLADLRCAPIVSPHSSDWFLVDVLEGPLYLAVGTDFVVEAAVLRPDLVAFLEAGEVLEGALELLHLR